MDGSDTSPLLASDGSPEREEEEEKENFDLRNVVLFHGKELMAKSFIRNPGQTNLVRVGVGREGIFKLESKMDKVLAHWKYDDIKDWSFSGYSFTLQLRSGGNYHIRTDDGESICNFIEAFKKDPDKALDWAHDHPPISNYPESGIRTLRRKFTQDPSRAYVESVKFYTLNRRSAKSAVDPTSRVPHNIEVDSRLKGSYPSARGIRSISVEPTAERPKLNGVGSNQEKLHAREVLSQKLEETADKEKRRSNGILMSPVSTKGEVTRDSPTHSGAATPTSTSSPLLVRKVSSSVSPQQPGQDAAKSAPATSATVAKVPVAAAALSVRKEESHIERKAEEKMTAKALDSNPNLHQQPSNQIKEPSTTANQILAGWQPQESSRPRDPSSSGSESMASNDTTPLLRPESSASSGPFSPTDCEFQFIGRGHSDENQFLTAQDLARERSCSGSSSSSEDSRYDRLERIRDEFINRDSLEHSPLLTSKFCHSDQKPAKSSRQEKGEDQLKYSKLDSPPDSPPTSPLSPLYDHLPPLSPTAKEPEKKKIAQQPLTLKSPPYIDLLPSPFDALVKKRNISQPCLSTPVSARESPCLETSPSPVIMELSEPEEGSTPVNSDDNHKPDESQASPREEFTGVVLRPKKKQDLLDPFADILGSPVGVSKLRWSQELNPLYDYIKGVKISEGMGSQDFRLYEAMAHERKKNRPSGKPPSMIAEEESEQSQSERELSTSPKENVGGMAISTATIPAIVEPPKEPMVLVEPEDSSEMSISAAAMCTLPRARKPHLYEDIAAIQLQLSQSDRPVSSIDDGGKAARVATVTRTSSDREGKKPELRSATMAYEPVALRRFRMTENKSSATVISPRLGKRVLQQRRSKTVASMDDTEAVKRKQKPMRVADNMKDFSYVMREFRLFFVKMPNGKFHREVFNINKPVCELRERLCDILGVDNPENYLLYVEGAILTTIREGDVGIDSSHNRVNRSTSLAHLVDNQSLPDQGTDPILLKTNLSLRMQGISTSRILSLMCDEEVAESHVTYVCEEPSTSKEFHKNWISVVQGNLPCSQDDAVKLAALQYQAYFLDRTAVHSVVGFCRPTEFLPVEFSGTRGIEQRMYKEQETLKLRTHQEIQEAYCAQCAKLATYDAVFFPAREPRKKLLQSMKLKPILLGVSSKGVMRVDPKTKEVLDMWEFQVLKNWAYSRRTFVLAFTNKNYPVESNQAKWISELVDFHVDTIMNSEVALSQVIPNSSEEGTSPPTTRSYTA